jgi:hypothetical protein
MCKSRRESGDIMNKVTCLILLLITFLAGCSSKSLEDEIAYKDRVIADLEREVIRIRQESETKVKSVEKLSADKMAMLESEVAEYRMQERKAARENTPQREVVPVFIDRTVASSQGVPARPVVSAPMSSQQSGVASPADDYLQRPVGDPSMWFPVSVSSARRIQKVVGSHVRYDQGPSSSVRVQGARTLARTERGDGTKIVNDYATVVSAEIRNLTRSNKSVSLSAGAGAITITLAGGQTQSGVEVPYGSGNQLVVMSEGKTQQVAIN